MGIGLHQIRRNLLISALFIGLSGSTAAGNTELEISVGFADRFRSGTVTPISILVRNPDSLLKAELVLEFTAGTALEEGARYTIRRPVNLSGGIPGVYRFSIPLEVSSYPLKARLEQQGFILAEKEKELRPLNVDRPLVVGLSRRPSLDFLIPVFSRKFDRPIELTYPRGEYLPKDAEGWDGVSLVIWHDLSPDIPDAASAEALGMWIEGGGEMIVIGGPWLSGRSFPESLLLGEIGVPRIVDGEAVYLPINAPPGEVLEYSRGLGRIRYIPRDMGRAFWEETAGETRLRSRPDTGSLEKLIAEAYFRNDEPLLPPVMGPLLFAGVFTLAAAGVLLAGRRIVSSRLRVLQIFILILLSVGTSAVALLRFSSFREQSVLPPQRLNMFITGNYGNSRQVRWVRFAGPAAVMIELPITDGAIPERPDGGDVLVVHGLRGTVLSGLELEPWKPLIAVLSSTVSGFGTPGMSEGIRHNGGETWFDAVLLAGGGAVLLTSEWNPGEILDMPAELPTEEDPVPELSDPQYSRILKNLIRRLDPARPMILARGAGGTVIVHLGGDI